MTEKVRSTQTNSIFGLVVVLVSVMAHALSSYQNSFVLRANCGGGSLPQ